MIWKAYDSGGDIYGGEDEIDLAGKNEGVRSDVVREYESKINTTK